MIMRVCTKCRAQYADDVRFCANCGAPLEEGAQTSGAYQRDYQQGGGSDQPAGEARGVGFGDAIRICLTKKYATFQGRATRAEYWYFTLFLFLMGLAVGIFVSLLCGDPDVAMCCSVLLGLGVICPSVGVFVRRLHDIGKSGWWYWIALIPYVGALVLLFFCCMPSQPKDNEYGPYVQ